MNEFVSSYYGEFYHHGIKGQRWGIRRFQNEDGSLTPAGEKRYSDSLTNVYDTDNDYDGDYVVPKGTSIFRRTQSNSSNDLDDKKYTYMYDYDNDDDNNFYKQFGKKVTEYELDNDVTLAGRKTLGKAFLEKMLSLDNNDDIDAMDTLYYDSRSRLGEDYVEDLFTQPYQPEKHVDALVKAGADMVSRMLSAQRHDALDAKLQKRGTRDLDTAANDIGRSIVDKLFGDGYSGMRDYTDYGSAANVDTPTVIFNPLIKLSELNSWLDD